MTLQRYFKYTEPSLLVTNAHNRQQVPCNRQMSDHQREWMPSPMSTTSSDIVSRSAEFETETGSIYYELLEPARADRGDVITLTLLHNFMSTAQSAWGPLLEVLSKAISHFAARICLATGAPRDIQKAFITGRSQSKLQH